MAETKVIPKVGFYALLLALALAPFLGGNPAGAEYNSDASLGALRILVLVAALAANGLAGVRAAVPFLVATGVIAAFVVWKHRANIARMRAGTEPKVGAKKPAGSGAASPETK